MAPADAPDSARRPTDFNMSGKSAQMSRHIERGLCSSHPAPSCYEDTFEAMGTNQT